MSRSYKPAGYSSVSPYLMVDGASRAIDFLVEVLGAEVIRRFPGSEGRILHAEVRIDDSVVMLTDGEGADPVPCHVHVYVPDVDATYERALAAGGTSVQAPVQKDDPDRRCGVAAPGGVTWWFATQVG